MANDAAFDEADLHAFADGRLEPVRAAALADSLASDRIARARIDGWKRQNDGLRMLFASVLFEPVPVRLLPATLAGSAGAKAAVAARETGAPGSTPSGAILAMTAIGVALIGFASGALATVAISGFGRAAVDARGAEVLPLAAELRPLEERAAESFRAALADPGRPSEFAAGDEARLQHWMLRQLSGAARIPDLHSEGWKLLGGRVVAGRYAPAAFLTYGQGSERLGLYVARDPVPAVARTAAAADGAIAVTSWSEDGLGIALTETADPQLADGAVEILRTAVRREMSDHLGVP